MAGEAQGARVRDRLRASMASGEYYTASQLARSIWNRKKGSAPAEAEAILLETITSLAGYEQYASACELACLCFESWRASKRALDDSTLSVVRELHGAMAPCPEQLKIALAAVKWSKEVGYESGHPALRYLAALSAWATGDFDTACSHFPFAREPEKFADMMYEWSTKGYDSEEELFLCRGVLMLLTAGFLGDANVYRTTFLSHVIMTEPTPLMNFSRFLLITLERDAAPLFQLLRAKYKPHLDRDPSFDAYLTEIGEKFYKLAAPKSLMASMMGMFSGLSAN